MAAPKYLSALPTRLSRVTTSGRLIREIDGLRFLAIFPVVIQHLSERLSRYSTIDFAQGIEYDLTFYLTNRGFIGVYIFFVLSGFILGMPFAAHYMHGDRKVSLRAYFWRRVTRLEPPYIIVMAGISVCLVLMGMYSSKEILPHFFASLFYMHGIIYHDWSFINPPVWSLEVEVQFYILAPFLALLFFRIKHKLWRRILFVAAILALIWAQPNFSRLTIMAHLHLFVVGFLLVDIYLNEWKHEVRKNNIFNFVAIAAIVSAILVWSWDHELINRLAFTVSLFVFVYSVFRSTWLNRLITLPWITAIGGMCYTIYLIHLPITEFIIRITRHIEVTDSFTINLLAQLCITIPFILIVSIVFFLAIEKPCMDKDWPRQLKNYVLTKLGILTT